MAEAKLKIYKVNTPEGSRLVRAGDKRQALNHVARLTITVAIASQEDLIALVSGGAKVETANEEAVAEGVGVDGTDDSSFL